MPEPKRVNALLTALQNERLIYLMDRLGLKKSEVVREAIDRLYHATVRADELDAHDLRAAS